MREQVYKYDKGEIKYRYPKIFEAMRLISKIGINAKSGSLDAEIDEFEMAANILEALEPYIIEVKHENNVIALEEVFETYALIPHLQNIGLEIINSISQQDKKRASRKK